MDCTANSVIRNTNKLHQFYDIIHYTNTLWLSSHSQIDCNKHGYFVGAICLQSLTKCAQTASPSVKIHRDKTRMVLQNSHFITIKTFLRGVLYRWLLPVVFGAFGFKCPVCGLQPANRTHTLSSTPYRQLENQSTKYQIPQAATTYIILSSS